MGMTPFRPKKTTNADYLFVAAGLIVCLVLLIWAFFG